MASLGLIRQVPLILARVDARTRTLRRCARVIAGLAIAAVASASHSDGSSPELEFFETKVRPLLATHCYECHSAESKKLQAGIRVDFRDGLLSGGDSGPALVPGQPDGSLLIEALRYESFEMPPKGKLPAAEIEIIERWVAMGAPWPEESVPQAGDDDSRFDLPARKANHWAWQPVGDPVSPPVRDARWPRNGIDHFVLEGLESAGLSPASEVDRRSLVRRLFFDLIGLPPRPDELAEILGDTRDTAIEGLVDRLLDSHHFGERWGRHWLDLVRYAESRGHEFDEDAVNAHQYRDYVIRALNADVPYDQFVREHVAGDLLPDPRRHPEQGFNESILGTGFWFLGEWVHSPVDIRKDEAERFDNMIDVMSKTFMGLTVACARCHDHKFDAISSADYYALSGFLQSSDFRQVRFESDQHNRIVAEELAAVDRKVEAELRPSIAAALAASADRLLQDVPDTVVGDREVTPSSRIPTSSRVLVDYGNLQPEDFLQDGVIYGRGPRRIGDLVLGHDGDSLTVTIVDRGSAVNDPFWHGLRSHREPATNLRGKLEPLPRSGRTLRTPTFELGSNFVNCQVRGSGYIVACVDSHRLVAGPLHGETVVQVKPEDTDPIRWVSLNLGRYAGHRLHLEFTPSEDGTLEVFQVVEGGVTDQLNVPFDRQVRPPPRRVLRQAIEAWSSGRLPEHERAHELATAIRWALAEDTSWRQAKLPAGGTIEGAMLPWSQRREALQRERRIDSQLAMAMMDGTGSNDQLLIRGNSANPGPEIPRRFLTAIDGERPLAIPVGSGRLQLAERIVDPANPLTSRVIVNRIWHHLMGRGIVPTTDDFGVLGQSPTHPELLDHLATWFDHNGRSIKKTIRYIVSSSSYRMSSRRIDEGFDRDPKNLLWHHVQPKRLEGETIRDSLLSLAGTLDRTMHGPSVPVHLTPFMDGRGRPAESGPMDGARRRSIYIAVRRNFLSPFMLAFDTPVPFSTMGRRNISNVPAQALILMNDPFVVDCSQRWGHRALVEISDGSQDRIAWMFESAFARPPTLDEQLAAMEFIQTEAASRGTGEDDAEIWGDLAHVLVNTKEFIFLR